MDYKRFSQLFQRAPGQGTEVALNLNYYLANPQHLVTLHPFTKTEVTAAATVGNVGGRPAQTFTGSSLATHGVNFCQGVANFRFVAGKQTRIPFSVYVADATNNEWCFGLTVVSTALMAALSGGTAPTDHFTIEKLKAETGGRLRIRKASGTQEATALNLVFADATWYDFEVVVLPDASVAGRGEVEIFVRVAGAAPQRVLATTVGSQLPDTVSTALAYGWLAGATTANVPSFSNIGLELAA